MNTRSWLFQSPASLILSSWRVEESVEINRSVEEVVDHGYLPFHAACRLCYTARRITVIWGDGEVASGNPSLPKGALRSEAGPASALLIPMGERVRQTSRSWIARDNGSPPRSFEDRCGPSQSGRRIRTALRVRSLRGGARTLR